SAFWQRAEHREAPLRNVAEMRVSKPSAAPTRADVAVVQEVGDVDEAAPRTTGDGQYARYYLQSDGAWSPGARGSVKYPSSKLHANCLRVSGSVRSGSRTVSGGLVARFCRAVSVAGVACG